MGGGGLWVEGNTIPETRDNTIQREGQRERERERGTQHLNNEECRLDIGLLERFLAGLVEYVDCT